MAHLGDVMTRVQSEGAILRIEDEFETRGFGMWAVEVPGVVGFVGLVGLSVPQFDAPFLPAVEVGWRLAFDHWGRGYATEAARASITSGFDDVGLDEIVAFTAAINTRSRAVMERLRLRRDPAGDFDHPAFGEGHRLRPHVLHRTTPAEWRRAHPPR